MQSGATPAEDGPYYNTSVGKFKTLPWGNWSSHFKFGSCTSFRFMGYGRQKWHSFFSTIGRHLECAIQTELVVELELALIERRANVLFSTLFLTAGTNVPTCAVTTITEEK